MKSTSIISTAVVLALLGLNSGIVIHGALSTQPTSVWTPPPILAAYLSTHPGDQGCISGTVVPFTIKNTTCSDTTGLQIQNAYSLNCSSNCKSGEDTTPPNNDVHWEAYSTVPSNPSTTYYNGGSPSATVSYWIGLQSCISGCTGTVYLLQAGLYYGVNSTTDSKHPVFFEELATSSGTCSTTFCGQAKVAVSPTDNIFFSVNYDTGYQYWTLYSEDTTTNKFDLYYVYYGTGSNQIPLTSIANALSLNEGQGSTSSSYFPSGVDFSNEIGLDASWNYQVGTSVDVHSTSGTSPTATLTWNTYTCYTSHTCGDTYIVMS